MGSPLWKREARGDFTEIFDSIGGFGTRVAFVLMVFYYD